MAQVSVQQIKFETEGDLQIVNAILGQVADTNTWSVNQFFGQIENIQATAVSTATAIGVSKPVAGVVTFAMGATCDVWVRVAGN